MISEKTVELNLTTELVNYYFYQTKNRPFILAPSQPQESKLGYDVEIGLSSMKSMFIQYKRAEPKNNGNILVYHLNRTKNKDQHSILKQLEKTGVLVFYALPKFYEQNFVINNRRRLLNYSAFLPPSIINPIGGDAGYHDLEYNTLTNQWQVFSEVVQEVNNNEILALDMIFDKLSKNEMKLETIKENLESIIREQNNHEDELFYIGNNIFCILG